MVGFYLSAMMLAETLANLLWQRIDRIRSTLHMLRIVGLLTMLAPLLEAYLFTGVFLLAGSSESGRAIALLSMLYSVAPGEEQASYIGLTNTALGFVSLLPIVSGTVIDWVGFEPVFCRHRLDLLGICGYTALGAGEGRSVTWR
jgi:hypothetical protein